MNLTVLGCHGPYPPAGGACSGYLLQHEGEYVLLDCGNGVLSKLQFVTDIFRLKAVFISHLHSDHVSDLFIMRYALQISLALGERETPLKIYVPAEPAEERERLPYKDVYEIETIHEGKEVSCGAMNFSFIQTLHPVSCCAIKVQDESGKTFVYSGDTAYFPPFITFARDVDLLLCEANYLQSDLESGAPGYHLSASQAAGIASEAGVQQLLLTHLPPHRERNSYLKEARQVFPAAVLAEEGRSYPI